ncbi:MAB_1171c family putative transporter [Streptomyces sp. G45]|uniref:MAB_1171c family putative transporter n=1 Tax=Streptomyces sp. G45 TaxID=3406627 RepID=UPI003C208503
MSYALLFVALAAAAGWKLHQLARAPEHRPLRWLTVCLLCATGAYPLAVPAVQDAVDGLGGTGTAKVFSDVLIMVMAYSLMACYLSTADGAAARRAARRRIRREGLVLLAAAGGVVTASATAPHHAVAHSTFRDADMTIPQVLAFYLGLGLYLGYVFAVCCRRTHGYARRASGSDAAGLWVATLGLLAFVAATAVRCVLVVVRALGGTVPHWLTAGSGALLVTAIPAFVAGVTWPGARSRLAAWRVRRHHRRVHDQLEPLWRLLSTTFPDTVLREPGRGRRARGAHRRYARRVVECQDGLLRIGPHLGSGEPAAPAPPSWASVAPEELAVRLRRAAESVRGGHAGPRRGIPPAPPQDDDSEAVVRRLVAVSQALRALPDGTP